jgi:hypothetical protein
MVASFIAMTSRGAMADGKDGARGMCSANRALKLDFGCTEACTGLRILQFESAGDQSVRMGS